jgi:hypothetical protein
MGDLRFFHRSLILDYLRKAETSPATIDLFERVAVTRGEYRIIPDLPAVMSSIPAYEERTRFLRALTAQQTLLLRLRVHPDSDVSALVAYWGKGMWGSDAQALFESLKHVERGAWVDIVELLPSLPASQLYTYPAPGNSLSAPVIRRDCHWTSFNFFRDTPDPEFSKPEQFSAKLRTDYLQVTREPRYGDILMLSRPDGSVVHSAVYIADDVYYTKNGDTDIHPWMLSTLTDLIKQYSIWVQPGDKLTLTYFRAKL